MHNHIWDSLVQDFMDPHSINVFRKAWNKSTEGCNIWLSKHFYHWLPEAHRGKILLDTSHFLQSSLNIWVGTLSEKSCFRWSTFGSFSIVTFMSSGIKEAVIFQWRRKKISARGFCINECQCYIGFALHLNKVKLLVLWVRFFPSENENRPYIVIHITFFGMGHSLSFNKNTVLSGIT